MYKRVCALQGMQRIKDNRTKKKTADIGRKKTRKTSTNNRHQLKNLRKVIFIHYILCIHSSCRFIFITTT
jgi:hypothetical protein